MQQIQGRAGGLSDARDVIDLEEERLDARTRRREQQAAGPISEQKDGRKRGKLRPPGANFHFEDQIKGGRMSFDYQLRSGVVEKSNALELMRSVGIELPD